ncbi:glycosyl hydrolase [Mucilaginibacter aquaedulcis]|uniref:glycosyl hydrolase n=1 Tax=Mucilaginibacter aquaedulcis TaxID=1187081 RepID=UPI0025B6036C|nr:glycosyl hydrolase [Mucilaginibacter aquaedulcis]MDN3548679.1 glycosyl hydrolase [Mucilaginibacter aquaedulcis]
MKLCKIITLLSLLFLVFFSCKKDNYVEPAANPTVVATMDATAATSTVASTALITNLKSGTSHAYTQTTITTNITYYTDRTYKITSVPSVLSGASLIKTACDDKPNTSANITFTLSAPATVYVAYDPRATALPSWLSTWTKTSYKIGVTDTQIASFNVYSKTYAAGTVTLGANMASPAKGVQCQYIVAVKASTTSGSADTATSSSLLLGINAHSMGNEAYSPVSMTTQMSIMKKMGMKVVRQNFNINSDGSVSGPATLNQLITAANTNGITILAMINITTLNYNSSESQNYAAGKLFGTNVATKNSSYFTYYELGNELDNKAIVSGNGDLATDYNTQKLKASAAYLKGMNDGIKLKQPGAKTMINASWKHFYFLQYMQTYGVTYDIVAWHWYSDMENAIASSSSPDITKKLSSLFTKPIWFTEVGQRWTNVSNIDQIQSDFINAFNKKMKANSQVKAGLFYEMFDEPFRTGAEGHYGFIKWTVPYTTWDYKTVAKSFFIN